MIYQVDSIAVNSREDWRHALVPQSPQSSRIGMFPGVAQRFVVRDAAMPGGVEVWGWLQGIGNDVGLAVTALHAAIDAFGLIKSSGSLHDVRVHDTTFDDCYLEEFKPDRRVEAFDPGDLSAGQVALQQQCFWRWMKTA